MRHVPTLYFFLLLSCDSPKYPTIEPPDWGGGGGAPPPVGVPVPPPDIPPQPKQKRRQYEAQLKLTLPMVLTQRGDGFYKSYADYDFDLGVAKPGQLEWHFAVQQPNAVNHAYGLQISGHMVALPSSACTVGAETGDIALDMRIGHSGAACVVPSLSADGGAWNQPAPIGVLPKYQFAMPQEHSYRLPSGAYEVVIREIAKGSLAFDVEALHLYIDETTLE